MKTQRVVLLSAVGAGVALAAWALWTRSPETRLGGDRPEARPSAVDPDREERSEVRTSAVPRRSTVRVTSAATGAPLTSARLTLHVPGGGQFMLPDRPELATADGEGRIQIPAGVSLEGRLLVEAPLHVTAMLGAATALGGDSDIEVALARAGSLAVSVVHERGAVVAGAIVRVNARAFGDPDVVPGEADGDPSSSSPMWIRTTSDQGVARFEPLPPAQYWVTAEHPDMVPIGSRDLDQAVALVGDQQATLTLKDMWGVVFRVPGESPVVKSYWDGPAVPLDIGIHVVSQLERCRRGLRERFPGCLVYVHCPREKPADPALVRCWVVTEDDSVWYGVAPFRPMREITEPVFMGVDLENRYRDAKIRVTNADGVELPLRLAVRNIDVGLRIDADAGDRCLLPHGRYRIGAYRTSKTLLGLLQEQEFVVSENEPVGDEVLLTLDTDLLPLRIRFEYPEPDARAPVHAKIRSAHGETQMVANYWPSQRELLMAVPAGPFHIEARSVAYEDAVAEVDVRGGDSEVVVKLVAR